MRQPSPPSSNDPDRSRRALTGLVIEVFRLNGDLLAVGDALVQDLGLTSARWQVLGAISLSPVPLPVAHIARNMGLTRQAVQRTVDDMRTDGLVCLEPNPHHRRAMLVAMTERGTIAYRGASERQERWATDLAAGLSLGPIEAAVELLRTLQQRLDTSPERTPLTVASTTQGA
ncbi:MarR family transcriptional regulator [Methylobacterium sp. WL64]|uniref:MarR family winged helix-turn-helix transcriptional regulator n=1 Tax=Methylobacterium sp. WL64 TaxID=2603894 RepID=UPI0011CC1C4C|nr:MarR family transcriptional regulator [Methylobacterium sp. WL64]TXN00732.1 MarR family transcriptional regulator [Methylobacterium sp. WL64]